MNHTIEQRDLDAIAFVGETLGPLFLFRPDSPKSAPLLDAMQNLQVAEAAAEWPFARPDEARSCLALIAAGAACESRDLLAAEYERLFVGPGKKTAPPWGSVYTDRDCVVFGQSTLKLRSWMRANGIARVGDGSEPEDHIGLMLLLMSWIAQNRADLLCEYLSEHLLTWASHYLEQLELAADNDLYAGLARLASVTLEGISRDLYLQVTQPRFYR